jgi:hypothetical protein
VVVVAMTALSEQKVFPIAVPPLRTERRGAFVTRTNGNCGFELMDFDVHPQSPRGRAFRDMREQCRLSMRDAAKALGITAVQVSGLERGSFTLTPEGWNEAERIVRATPPTWKDER